MNTYSMFDRLRVLKEKGYTPDVVFDIGAYHGNWTKDMLSIYRNSKYFLFEAIDYSELKQYANHPNVKVFNVLLNDKIEQVNWYQMKNTGDSMFREKSHHFVDCEPITKTTIDLDTHSKIHSMLNGTDRVFIKIDCQGAEIPILKGSKDILSMTDFVVLEIPLFGQYNEDVPNFLEHIQYMDSIGFVPYDIVDNHYINNFNMQVDMLFINKNHNFNKLVNNMLL